MGRSMKTRKRPARSSLVVLAVLAPMLATCASVPAPSGGDSPDFGVLVMAHGGSEDWNDAVLEAVGPLAEKHPVEVAFGMASAATLQEATGKLEERGVRRIGVLRLFVSGESWLERTEQIFGLESGAPEREDAPPSPEDGSHDFHSTFWRIETRSGFALSREGLARGREMSAVLLDRARALSEEPSRESVLILAHGPGDDEENERWIRDLAELARPLSEQLPFRAVEVLTLREDWAPKREEAETRIRSFVAAAGEDGGSCLVIPFRVFGFGPYAEVLEGLDYRSDGRGLLPHEAVSTWIDRQVAELASGPFRPAK